jgi:hypothetical protein
MNEQHAFRYTEGPARRADLGQQTIIRPGYEQQRDTFTTSTTRRTRASWEPPANPHRAGFHAGLHPEDAPYLTGEDEDDDAYAPAHTHTSVRRYDQLPATTTTKRTSYEARPVVAHTAVPSRRSAQTSAAPSYTDEEAHPSHQRLRRRAHLHPLVYLGVGMLVALTLWTLGSAALSWWGNWQDDLHYGRPRTTQYDVVVGHNDSPAHPTHFLALNLNGQVVIVEIPGGDLSKSITYQGPRLYGQNAALAPVTLTFADLTHDGKLDMLVHFQGSAIIYRNEQGKFVPQH